MNTSNTIGAIGEALAGAQKRLRGAAKDSDNPFFKSKYADLESVWEACRDPLADAKIAVIQAPSSEGNHVCVTTRMVHASGEWIESALVASAKDSMPQSIIATVTYLRRASLAAMVGVYAEDDDGETAQGRGTHKPIPTPQKALEATPRVPVSPPQDRTAAKAQAIVAQVDEKAVAAAQKNIAAAKVALGDDTDDTIEERRKAIYAKLAAKGKTSGQAVLWLNQNRLSEPGSVLTLADLEQLEARV